MKRLFLIPLILLSFSTLILPQTNATSYTKDGMIKSFSIPITLAKSSSAYYSEEFDLEQFLKYDSTSSVANILWQSNDTVQVTIALQVKNTLKPGTTTAGSWQTACTISGTTPQANAGNDTLYTRKIVQRGSVASGVTDIISMSGKMGDKGRISVTFANPTTVGNSGTFRLWCYLVKRTQSLKVF